MNNRDMQSEFLTIKETAVIFSVHRNTILRAIKRGFLIAIRIGDGKKSPYRISRKSIEMIHASIILGLNKKAKTDIL